MASSARIDELRTKFDENPRRYFAPLANEYRKAGDFEQAIFICQEYLPQQPGHMSGHIVFGQALFEARRLDEARTVFDTALTLDPENLIALRHLGDIARMEGNPASARDWYRRVLEADPRNEEVSQLLSDVERSMSAAPTPLITPAVRTDSAAGGTPPAELTPPATIETIWGDLHDGNAATAFSGIDSASPHADVPSPAEVGEGDLGVVAGADDQAAPADPASADLDWGAAEAYVDEEFGRVSLPPVDGPFGDEAATAERAAGAPPLDGEPDVFAPFRYEATGQPPAASAHRAVAPADAGAPAAGEFDLIDLDASFAAPEDTFPTTQPGAAEATAERPLIDARSLSESLAKAAAELGHGSLTGFDLTQPLPAEPPAASAPELFAATPHADSPEAATGGDAEGAKSWGAAPASAAGWPAETAPWEGLRREQAVEAAVVVPEPTWQPAPRVESEAHPEPQPVTSPVPEPDQAPRPVPLPEREPDPEPAPNPEPLPWPVPDAKPDVAPALAPTVLDDVPPRPFLTETMAKLYLAQGHHDAGVDIYRELVERNPSDHRLRQRLQALETPLPGGPTIREFLRSVFAGARAPEVPGAVAPIPSIAAAKEAPMDAPPTTVAPASPPAADGGLDTLFGTGSPAPADQTAAVLLSVAFAPAAEDPAGPSGKPALRATGELSLASVFRTAADSGATAVAPASSFAFDRFIAPDASAGAGVTIEPEQRGEESEEDATQFRSWLDGLTQ